LNASIEFDAHKLVECDITPTKLSSKLEREKEATLKYLLASKTVSDKETIRAYNTVPREEFVLDHLRRDAYIDTPLPIGEGQTISAIHMCLIYLELLNLKEGLKVLEVGGGSGYHAALCAEIVSPTGMPLTGHVYTIERIPKLVEFAKHNLERAGYSDRVTVILGDGTLGYPPKAPFDRIMVAAASPKTPQSLIDQMVEGGSMLIPIGHNHYWQDLILVEKKSKSKVETRKLMAVAFVPLIGEEGWNLRT